MGVIAKPYTAVGVVYWASPELNSGKPIIIAAQWTNRDDLMNHKSF